MKNGLADIALVPAGALPEMGRYNFISDYCIGAVRDVKTVLLLSHVPLKQISRIHLDFDSRTSVELVKILMQHWWKRSPLWEKLRPGEASVPTSIESLVAIGDKTFQLREDYPYVYDLAEEWIRFTGLPFVFAVWIARTDLPEETISRFSLALEYGTRHKPECLEYFKGKLPAGIDCLSYLEDNISYGFDPEKKEGLERFLAYIR
jgi:chorismate dehydratase